MNHHHSKSAQEIYRLRKSEETDRAYEISKEILANNQDDPDVQHAFAWIIYDKIKEKTAQKPAPKTEIESLLREYFKLKLIKKPSAIHSFILYKALTLTDWDNLIPFIRYWGIKNFREEDMLPYKDSRTATKNNKSLYLSCHYAIGKNLKSSIANLLSEEDKAWAIQQLNDALKIHPDDIWLHYYLARYYIKSEYLEKSRKHIFHVIKENPYSSWALDMLGDFLSASGNTEDAITCYYHAIFIAKKDIEIINTRIDLAKLLAKQHRYEEASIQVATSLKFRQQEGWKIPNDLTSLHDTHWFIKSPNPKCIPEKNKIKKLAEELIYSISDTSAKKYTGTIKKNPEQSYAFLITDEKTNIFIPNNLVSCKKLTDGQTITCQAIPSKDKKGKPSLKAIKIITSENQSEYTQKNKSSTSPLPLIQDIEKNPHHHICLISNAPMSTLGSLLDPKIEVSSATLVCTPYTYSFAQQQARVLEKRNIKTNIEKINNPEDLAEIEKTLTKIKNFHKKASINITGGNKLMTVVAHKTFNEPEYEVYYVEHKKDQMIWINHPHKNHSISDIITLDEYFQAMGYTTSGRTTLTPKENQKIIIEHLIDSEKNIENLSTTLDYIQTQKTNKNQTKFTEISNNKLVELLLENEMAALENHELKIPNETWRFLQGGWLEQYHYLALEEKHKQDPTIQDIAIGVKINNPRESYINKKTGNKQPISHELDVAYLQDNSLHIIECKTGKNFKEDSRESLLKLHALKTQLVGIKGTATLVTLYPINPSDEAVAKELGIDLVQGFDQIKRFSLQNHNLSL